MKKKICAIATLAALAALAIAVGTTWAATASPTLGSWTGKYKGVKPATSLSFTVAVQARTGKRVVSFWQSGGNFNAPCADARGTTTSVDLTTSPIVNAAGKFKGVASDDNGFGLNSWTVTGTFKNARAASGTVAINLAITSTKRCKFTVPWTASLEPTSHPVHGTTYKGAETISGNTLSFHVSANGKALTTLTWHGAIIGGSCPGISTQAPSFTVRDVPVHGSSFAVNLVSGKGSGTTNYDSITGHFLAGGKAAGTISNHAVITGFGTTCVGQETWTAHTK
jgi:hypothetical protein